RAPPIPPIPRWRGKVGNLAARRQPAPPGFFCPLGRGRSRDDGGAAVAFTLAVLLNHAHVAKWRMRRSTNPGGGGSTPPVRAILLHYAILTLHFATVYVTYFLPALKGSVTSLLTKGLRPDRDRHLPGTVAGADAAERGYFAFEARGRWFESNSGRGPDSSVVERFTCRIRHLLGSVYGPSRG